MVGMLQNIEEKNPPMDNGNTPFHMAASNGNLLVDHCICLKNKRLTWFIHTIWEKIYQNF